MPQLVGKFSIRGPGPHTPKFGRVFRHRDGNIAIFAIHSAKSFQLTACRAPEAGCRSLFRCLHVARWVNDRSSVLIQHSICANLFSGHVTYQVGDYPTWMKGESSNGITLAYGIERHCKERVCSLRLSVSNPTVVFTMLKIGVLESYRSSPVSDRGQRNHACALRPQQRWPQPSSKLKMSQVVCREL